jgi:hypothetical protein
MLREADGTCRRLAVSVVAPLPPGRLATSVAVRTSDQGIPEVVLPVSGTVPGEVTVAKVIETLKELHERHYKGDQIKATDITQMQQTIKKDVIKVVGMGAPRPDLPPGLPEGVAEQVSAGGPPVPPRPPIPELWIKIGPQARMMAQRAARVDAMRRLVSRAPSLLPAGAKGQAAVAYLLTHRHLARAMGEAARERVSRRFSIEAMGRQHHRLDHARRVEPQRDPRQLHAVFPRRALREAPSAAAPAQNAAA